MLQTLARCDLALTVDANYSRTMSLPRQVRAVVFDMDGLIFDTESLYFIAMGRAAQAIGREMPLEVFRSMVGLTSDGSRERLVAHYGAEFPVEPYWADCFRIFHEIIETQLCLKAGVIELLDALDARGLPHAIATSSRHESVEHHLALHGLAHRFPVVVAHGDYARGKPHPDPFLTAAAKLGVAPELCLALEDSHNGVRAAAAAGMMTVMVPDLLAATAEMERLCIRIAADLHEVRAMLGE